MSATYEIVRGSDGEITALVPVELVDVATDDKGRVTGYVVSGRSGETVAR